MKKITLLVVAAFAISLAACTKTETVTPTPSLYDRLGGVTAISAVVDQFITNVASNPKMVRTFQPLLTDVGKNGANSAKLIALRTNLINQISEAAGGPQKYTGKDMVTAHTGMKITDDEFSSLVGNLVDALDKFKVAATEKDPLLSVLGGLKGSIVGK
jgi:hemoglobin